MAQRPNEDTEPRVQQLFVGLYPERGIGPKGLANAGLCVIRNNIIFKAMEYFSWQKDINKIKIFIRDLRSLVAKSMEGRPVFRSGIGVLRVFTRWILIAVVALVLV